MASRAAILLVAAVAALVLALVAPEPVRADIPSGLQQSIPVAAGGPDWSGSWNASSSSYSPTNDSMGLFFWDANSYDGTVTVYFEVVLQSSSATAGDSTVGLFASGETTTPVASASNTGSSAERVRSGSVTLADDTAYTVRTKNLNGASVSLFEARIVVVQASSWGNPISKTETVVEIGDNFSTSSTSYATPTDERFWTIPNVASKYDGNEVCYFEGTLATSNATHAATLALVGGAGSGSPLSTVSTTQTSLTRVRSSSFTCPSSADDVHPELKIADASATAAMVNARIVVTQSEAAGSEYLTKTQTYLPIQTSTQTTTSTSLVTLGGGFRWEPANFGSGVTASGVASGVGYKVSANAATHRLCEAGGSGCDAGTALTGSDQTSLASTSLAWSKSGAVTLPGSASTLHAQYKMNSAGTLTLTQTYLALDVTGESLGFIVGPNVADFGAILASSSATGNIGALDTVDSGLYKGWHIRNQSGGSWSLAVRGDRLANGGNPADKLNCGTQASFAGCLELATDGTGSAWYRTSTLSNSHVADQTSLPSFACVTCSLDTDYSQSSSSTTVVSGSSSQGHLKAVFAASATALEMPFNATAAAAYSITLTWTLQAQ